jgi:hypothetical protein
MKRKLRSLVVPFVLAYGLAAAQPNKGQQNGAQTPGAQQPGNANQTQNVQPQMYRLQDLPVTRKDALANLKYKSKTPPRFIWYKAVDGKSTTLPVQLELMTCNDIPPYWAPGSPEYDPQFAKACKKTSDGEKSLDSVPTQNKHPLIAGQGVIIAIYDKDDLLKKLKASFVGLSIQAQNGSYLTLGTLRPAVSSSSGAGAPTAGAPGGGTQGVQQAAAVNIKNQTPVPPCVKITAESGDNQVSILKTAFPKPLRVRVTDKDNKPVPQVDVNFLAPVSAPTVSGERTITATLNSISLPVTRPASLRSPPDRRAKATATT